MAKKNAIILVLLLLFGTRPAYAFDWIKLHEQADRMTSSEAKQEVKSAQDSQQSEYLLGLVSLNAYEDSQAKAAFERILSKDPHSVPARWGLAEILRREHALEDAAVQLSSLITEDPSFAPAYISLAYLRFTQADFQPSVDLASHVLALGAENADISNYVRAYLLVAAGKGMLAHYGGFAAKLLNGTAVFPLLKKAQALQPHSAGVMFGLGAFYLLAPRVVGGNPNLAKDYLQKAVSADPHLVDAYVRLGQAYKLQGDTLMYQTMLQKALSLDPQNELALDIQKGQCKFICVK